MAEDRNPFMRAFGGVKSEVSLLRFGAFTAVALLTASFLCAQDKPSSDFPKPRLWLACPVSPCRFRQGEVIPLDLVFSAEAPGFGVFSSYPDRFVYGDLDRFTVSPTEGTGDPLGVHAREVAVGGSFNPTRDPLFPRTGVKVRVELNQWIYFEMPGTYAVTAVSLRACIWGPSHGLALEEALELTSNPIGVEIVVADPDWQRSQLARIVRALPADGAVQELTYLRTGAAFQEIRDRLAAAGPPMYLNWRIAQLVLLQHADSNPSQ